MYYALRQQSEDQIIHFKIVSPLLSHIQDQDKQGAKLIFIPVSEKKPI